MPVTVIVGGQFGSEGKGKIAKYMAEEQNAEIAIRCGGPNSGHTIVDKDDRVLILQHIPTPSIIPGMKSVLCAGMYINLDILFKEIDLVGIKNGSLLIDPNAVIINDEIINAEKDSDILKGIGSTKSGTGEAVKRRIQRRKDLIFAKDIETLKPFLCDTRHYLREQLKQGKRIVLEGTQGYGLSLLHSEYYPFVTSRDTTASGFLAEAGLSPLDVDDIVLVIRTFPIRVHGESGPLTNEINWETLTNELESEKAIVEYTSVSKKIRRVARFEPEIVKKAIEVNQPTKIVLNHVDYLKKDITKGDTGKLKDVAKIYTDKIHCNIDYMGISNNITLKM